MTLDHVFQKVIHTRGLLTSMGYSRHTVQDLKRNHVSTDRMREVVSDAGYKCVQKEDWKLKVTKW